MYTFYGQPKYTLTGAGEPPIGYELFIREQQDGLWRLPLDFNAISAATITGLLDDIVARLPHNVTMLSFNLEQKQYIDPTFVDALRATAAKTPIRLFVELTEREDPAVSLDQLRDASKAFVCIDDVGTGSNTPELVLFLNDYISEYKFALQNFRPFADIRELEPQLAYWHDLANTHHKMLAIEGFETQDDVDLVQAKYPCDVIQGYYLGKPAKL